MRVGENHGRAGPVLVWEFSPRSDGAVSREEATRTRARWDAVVRAGHGLGIELEIAFTAAAEPRVSIATSDPATHRWVERVLASAYDPGQWKRIAPPGRPDPAEVLRGRRRALPGERSNRIPDAGALARTAVLALSAVRPGVEMTLRVRPAASPGVSFDLDRPRTAPELRPSSRPAGGSYLSRPAVGGPGADDGGPLWRTRVELRLPTGLPSVERRRAARAAATAWYGLDGTGVSFARWHRYLPWAREFLLSSTELVAVLPPRDGGGAPPSPRGTGEEGLPLGRTAAGTVVSAPVEAGQGRHLAILGETGMGKSSLLVELATRAARLGGVVVLDPLGETAREIRRHLDAVRHPSLWIAPGANAPTINALDGIGGEGPVDPVRAERRIADIVHALRRVRAGRYADSAFWGPRLEEMLTRAVRAAATFPGGTLGDAHTLLSTSGITRRPVPPGAEEALRELAERVRERPEDADGARRLLFEVVRNPTLGRLLCARRPDLTAAEFVRPGRIVLVSGEAAHVGEPTARYLLAVYLALVWSELLASPATGKTFVVLDEAQWFAHESLSEMLRLARRRNVHVLLATQSIGSLPDGVRESVWTNVADFVAFRGSPDEAREFARLVPGITTERLLSLSRGEAASLVGKGASVRWIRTARIPTEGGPPPSTVGFGGAPERERTPSADGSAGSGPGNTPGGPDGTSPPPGPEIEGALRWLAERARDVAGGELLRLPIDELRARFPDDPDLVRRVGAHLGRVRGIRRTERTARGSVWWVDPAQLGVLGRGGPDSHASGSEVPQPS